MDGAIGVPASCTFATSKDCGSTGWGSAGSGIATRYSLSQDQYWPTTIDADGGTAPVENGYDWVCSFDRKGKAQMTFVFSQKLSVVMPKRRVRMTSTLHVCTSRGENTRQTTIRMAKLIIFLMVVVLFAMAVRFWSLIENFTVLLTT